MIRLESRHRSEATKDHVMFLRCEGLSYVEIARRLGVTKSRVGQIAHETAQQWQKNLRHAKFRLEPASTGRI